MINIQKMMQQAKQMQLKMGEIQEKFKDILVEGEAGGGMVKVTMNCQGTVRKVSIAPEVANPGDVETLEDLIVAACNNALSAKEAKVEEETKSLMEGMGLPSDGQLPF